MKRKKTISYKLSIGINVNWIGLIRHYHPELKNKDKAQDFVNNFIAEEDVDIKGSLFQNDFRLIEFYDAYSGMFQVWSDYHKTFIDDLVIRGSIFSPSSYFPQKDAGNKLFRSMWITPSYIGLSSNLPDGEPTENDMISTIPFDEIKWFLHGIYQEKKFDTSYFKIKQFPVYLKEKLENAHVRYEHFSNFDTDKEIRLQAHDKSIILLGEAFHSSHHFTTPLYGISIDMRFFEPV